MAVQPRIPQHLLEAFGIPQTLNGQPRGVPSTGGPVTGPPAPPPAAPPGSPPGPPPGALAQAFGGGGGGGAQVGPSPDIGRSLMIAGLRMMAAGGQSGATLGGSIGIGGLAGMADFDKQKATQAASASAGFDQRIKTAETQLKVLTLQQTIASDDKTHAQKVAAAKALAKENKAEGERALQELDIKKRNAGSLGKYRKDTAATKNRELDAKIKQGTVGGAGGQGGTFGFRQRAYLALHPGDAEGALAFADDPTVIPPKKTREIALRIAAQQLKTDIPEIGETPDQKAQKVEALADKYVEYMLSDDETALPSDAVMAGAADLNPIGVPDELMKGIDPRAFTPFDGT